MFSHFVKRSLHDLVRSPRLAEVVGRERAINDDARLEAATHWLMRSIDVCEGRASSKGYRFLRGWMPPYPETSGYIIPTLLVLGRETGQTGEYAKRARAIGEWLLSLQQPSGGFLGGELGAHAGEDVFDTGMILLGLNALIHEFRDDAILAAACRAGDFLIASMDADGCFVRNLHHGLLHAYNVRAAWSLVALGKLTGNEHYAGAGVRNARWTRAQQNAAGFFDNNGFKKDGNANTHGTAYVMRGLLQIYELTGDRENLDSVLKAAIALQAAHDRRGWIAAELGPDWDYLSSHICLTGYAQLAIIFYRLDQLTGELSFGRTADQLLRDVGQTQDLHDQSKPHFGAIAGSFPIYGRYAPLQYPNWATKFFVDAHIAKRHVARGQQRHPLQLYGG